MLYQTELTEMVPCVGIEPTTTRLKGARSTDWAKSALTGFIGVHTRPTDWATNDIAIGQDSNLRPRLYSRKKKKLLYETILCFTATCQTLRDGIEPPTSRLTVERSNQLSYQSFISSFTSCSGCFTSTGIWTQEASAVHLKCTPFDRTRVYWSDDIDLMLQETCGFP